MISASRMLPAPVDLGSGLATVSPGTPMQVEVRFEAVIEGVLASGTAQVDVRGECARCLDPVSWPATVAFSELFVHELGEDEELPLLSGDLLDLEPVVRDAVVLALPLAPLCDPECPGLCVECGAKVVPGHSHDTVDPRWAGLAGYPASAPADDDQ
jgi:uncharacterized protein